MKIRNGFVSNSSSSSFIFVGIEIDDKCSPREIYEKFCQPNQKLLDSCSNRICCGKELDSNFCPSCGKKKEEVPLIVNWDVVLKNSTMKIPLHLHINEKRNLIGKKLSSSERGEIEVSKIIEISDLIKNNLNSNLNPKIFYEFDAEY